jgi:hypothetical protein
MTFTEQALRILGNETRSSRETVRWINRVMAAIAREKEAGSGIYGRRTKEHIAAAQESASLLNKLQNALKRCAVVDVIGFPLNIDDDRHNPNDIRNFKTWSKHFAQVGKAKIPRKNLKDHAKLLAAKAAFDLLEKQKLEAPLTRKGRWCRLAAILYGEPTTDFFHHCREVKRGLRTVADSASQSPNSAP